MLDGTNLTYRRVGRGLVAASAFIYFMMISPQLAWLSLSYHCRCRRYFRLFPRDSVYCVTLAAASSTTGLIGKAPFPVPYGGVEGENKHENERDRTPFSNR